LAWGAVASEPGWLEYHGEAGFFALYPKGWTVLEKVAGRLDIVSPGKRAEGVIIAPGQSNIVVVEIENPGGKDFDSMLVNPGEMIKRKEIPIDGSNKNGCGNVYEIDELIEVVPGYNQVKQNYFCRINNRVFDVYILNWEDDYNIHLNEGVVIRLVQSLKVR